MNTKSGIQLCKHRVLGSHLVVCETVVCNRLLSILLCCLCRPFHLMKCSVHIQILILYSLPDVHLLKIHVLYLETRKTHCTLKTLGVLYNLVSKMTGNKL
eukprot:GHVL01025160.1.p1 GENE.GHVL01025160.1~~GHVL01025160.1.p1  ORF type:complete len:100 (+),score=0.64 GHVL01025160.1:401-700(+)